VAGTDPDPDPAPDLVPDSNLALTKIWANILQELFAKKTVVKYLLVNKQVWLIGYSYLFVHDDCMDQTVVMCGHEYSVRILEELLEWPLSCLVISNRN
jgi:hypothetical protein